MKNQLATPKWQIAPITWFVLLITTITLFISFSQFTGPVPQSASVPVEEFSTDRAMGYLENVAKEPHPMGSQANMAVRDYILNHFKELGIETEVQKKDVTQIKETIYSIDDLTGNLENIIAKIPGKTNPENAVIVTAHYDSTAKGPGAADDGYGVSAILETARAMKQLAEPSNTVYFLLTDGEEPGMLGASALAEERKDILDQAKVIINLEARGNKGVPILFETNENNLEIIQVLQDSVPYPVAYSFAYEVYKLLHNDTDFSVYKNIKKQGYNFANIDGADAYHKMADNVANVDKGTLQQFGTIVYPLVKKYAFMNADEFKQVEGSSDNAVYFPLFKSSLVVYPQSYVIPLLGLLLLLTVVVVVIGLKKGVIKATKTIISTLLLFIGLLAAAVLTYLYAQVVELIFTLDSDYNNVFMIIFMVLTVLFCLLAANWLVKKFGAGNVAVGSILVWVALASVTSALVKGMSYAFVLPALLLLVATIPVVFQFQKSSNAFYKYLFVAFWLVPSVMLLGPILYLVYIAMTIGMSPVIALLGALVAFTGIISIKWMFGAIPSHIRLDRSRGESQDYGLMH